MYALNACAPASYGRETALLRAKPIPLFRLEEEDRAAARRQENGRHEA
jgi:hypothetical protein